MQHHALVQYFDLIAHSRQHRHRVALAAHVKSHSRRWVLQEWKVEERQRPFLKDISSSVFDYTDNLQLPVLPDRDVFSERILTGPVTAGERLIDDHSAHSDRASNGGPA